MGLFTYLTEIISLIKVNRNWKIAEGYKCEYIHMCVYVDRDRKILIDGFPQQATIKERK